MDCAVCSNALSGRRRLYCSDGCYKTANRRKHRGLPVANPSPRPCVECDTVFTPASYHARQRHCSVKCKHRHKQRLYGGYDKRTNEPIKCEVCGTITTKQSQKHKFCSVKCWRNAHPGYEDARKEYKRQWYLKRKEADSA